jgi:hypothetical protein
MYENIILKVENRNVLKVPLSSIWAIFLGMIYDASDLVNSEFKLYQRLIIISQRHEMIWELLMEAQIDWICSLFVQVSCIIIK